MDESIINYKLQIDEIEQELKTDGLSPRVRELLLKDLDNLRTLINLGERRLQGDVNLGDEGRVYGVAVGINLGSIIYGRTPEENERQRLVWYLHRLAAKMHRLPLRALDEQLDQGQAIALSKVYVMLATETKQSLTKKSEEINQYFQQEDHLKLEYDSDWALPSQALFINKTVYANYTRTRVWISKALLATEAANKYRNLVLLGDPGGGKSTFLRHLAWTLALRGLDQEANTLYGWDNQNLMLPIILPLRTLAILLAQEGNIKNTDNIIYKALSCELNSYSIGQVDDLLSESLHRGNALLLFDGLDEVPLQAATDMVGRKEVLQAVRNFVEVYNARVIITCRKRAFDKSYQNLLSWHVETLAPFTLGQIRYFVEAWYGELVNTGQIKQVQAVQLAKELIKTIIGNHKLRDMARTPLLITMMALVLYNKNELPRDRPQLYERVLELLLGQWDKVHEGQNLTEVIGRPDWGIERILRVLDNLAYQAHEVASSGECGQLTRKMIRDELILFFEKAMFSDPWKSAQRCLEYFELRSGLLVPYEDETETYAFAHLTLQEHCAGRHIMLNRDAAKLVMLHRTDDRWREPIFLGLGVIQQTKPELIEAILTKLIDRNEYDEKNVRRKSSSRWQRDLILAAEIGDDRDWNYLRTQSVNVDHLQPNLKKGLVKLLQDRKQLLSFTERAHAAFLLGDLGDTRFPVTIEQWEMTIRNALRNDTNNYFCRVEAGTYIIGSAADDTDADNAEKPQHTVTFNKPFLISRYPITNNQWQMWINSGGLPSRFASDPNLNRSNQPVVGINWQQCFDFCLYLSQQIGRDVRLPTEAEWEAAARGLEARLYPWGKTWLEERAWIGNILTGEELIHDLSIPVGCYPAGSTSCGVLDMAGNVDEWTMDVWNSYPNSSIRFMSPDERALRGGSYLSSKNQVRCAARNKSRFDACEPFIGFRVVVTNFVGK